MGDSQYTDVAGNVSSNFDAVMDVEEEMHDSLAYCNSNSLHANISLYSFSYPSAQPSQQFTPISPPSCPLPVFLSSVQSPL